MGCICEFSHRCIEKLKERVPDCLKCSTNKNRNKDKDIDRHYEVNNNDLSSDTTSKNKPTTSPADEFPKIKKWIRYAANNQSIMTIAPQQSNNSSWHPKYKYFDERFEKQPYSTFAPKKSNNHDLPTPKTYIDSDSSMRPDANNNHSNDKISRISHTSSDFPYTPSIVTIAPNQSNNSSWHPKYEYFDERFEKQPDSTFAPKQSNNPDNQPHRYSESEIKTLI